MKKIYGMVLPWTMAAMACTGRQEVRQGVVVDATMNTLTIEVGKDTLQFSTVDAERATPGGVSLQDTVKVYYRGGYRAGMPAVKVEAMGRPKATAGNNRDGER